MRPIGDRFNGSSVLDDVSQIAAQHPAMDRRRPTIRLTIRGLRAVTVAGTWARQVS